jgi:uncharacterized phage protein (TIGR01671 family)
MREILFRGKKYNGEWAHGYYVQANNSWHGYGKHKERIVCSACANGGWFALQEKHAVIPETVGQYTGLKDKNGKKIFEGDIVKSIETKETGVVQFFPEHSAFMIWCKFSNEVGFLYECTSIAEVIGNIHDNPELIRNEV